MVFHAPHHAYFSACEAGGCVWVAVVVGSAGELLWLSEVLLFSLADKRSQAEQHRTGGVKMPHLHKGFPNRKPLLGSMMVRLGRAVRDRQ